jgi:hypothetical protein
MTRHILTLIFICLAVFFVDKGLKADPARFAMHAEDIPLKAKIPTTFYLSVSFFFIMLAAKNEG